MSRGLGDVYKRQGFAPAQSPKVLCYITLDGTPSGSDAAAVPFQSIMANALDVLGIPHTK